jgi:two-component system sensor histidine kinase BaeS
MRRRAFWGVVAVVMVTLGTAGAAAALLVNRSVQDSVRAEFERQAGATARLVEGISGSPRVGSGRQAELRSLLAVAATVGGHDYVEVALVGPEGTVLASGAESVLLARSPVDPANLTRPIQFDAVVDGESVAAYLIPVRVGRASVVVAIGTGLQIVPWAGVLWRFVAAIALGVGLAGVLAWWLARSLSRRLDGLRRASRRMAAGDLEVRIHPGRGDEVSEVEAAFNDMAEGMASANRREREFLASVSHDLRTPLTTIRGYAEALEEGRVGAGEMSRVAAVLHGEAARLGRLVEDLMLLSRLEAGEFGLRPEAVEVAAHLAGVVEAFRPRAEGAGVDLAFSAAQVGVAVVDPDRLAQMVANLLENALRYTDTGGEVRLSVAGEGADIVISVADTGPGIDPDDLPRIFERLYVAKRYRAVRPEGSGLGLSIVKELAEAMSGRVAVDSGRGEGTRVEVRLPVTPATPANPVEPRRV